MKTNYYHNTTYFCSINTTVIKLLHRLGRYVYLSTLSLISYYLFIYLFIYRFILFIYYIYSFSSFFLFFLSSSSFFSINFYLFNYLYFLPLFLFFFIGLAYCFSTAIQVFLRARKFNINLKYSTKNHI